MRSICSKVALLAAVSALTLVISSQAQLIWQVGLDDNGWPLNLTGGGPNTAFVQENGTISTLPGNPNSPRTDQQGDNDYYFAGIYTNVIPGVTATYGNYVPVGTVLVDETSAERAFAAADNDLRYHFNLPASLRSFDLLSVRFDAVNLDSNGADNRYGIEVYFNGVLVQTQIVIRPAQLDVDYVTPQFKLSSVGARVGPGFDNVVSLKGINYNGQGGGNWMGIDYVQLNAAPGVSALPYAVNVGGNKTGSVVDNDNGSFTIVGGGSDIWDSRDEFTYAYTEVVGDFDVKVRVDALQNNGAYTKAGIMARETLSEFARNAFLRTTPTNGGGNNTRLAYRTGVDNASGESGGQHEDLDASNPNITTMPVWLRLLRRGSVIFSSNSVDGVAWNFVASQDTTNWGGGALSNKLFLGLAVTRNGTGLTATGQFSGFAFNTNNAQFSMVDASSRGNPTGVRVTFNNPVGASGLNPSNYSISVVSGPTNLTTVKALRFTTANDATERDPILGVLEGTTADPSIGAWIRIATFDTGLTPITARNTVGPIVPISNSTAYRAYRLIFTTVRNAATANSMQIAEIELLDANTNRVTTAADSILGVQAVPGSPVSLVAVAGTAGNVNNYPAAESPMNSIDANAGTKYLNFAKTNVGILVVPTIGVSQAKPSVISAAAGPNANKIQLTVSPLIDDATYILSVSNVLSASGGALSNLNWTFVHGGEFPARRIWVTHNKVQDFNNFMNSDAAKNGIGDVIALGGGVFPPVQANDVFEDPVPDTGSNERFAGRIAGVLSPRASGNYTFYWSSDDNGRLFLSSDASPANKVQIASEPAWNGRREYINGGNQASRGTPPANISAAIPLQAGNVYYLEGIYTEGGGGNNGSATWLPPGGAAVANGTLPISETNNFIPSRMYDGNTFQILGPVQIQRQPTNLTVTALLPATFRVSLEGTPSYTYQWRRNGVPIPGANGPTYTIPAAQLTDDQVSFSVAVANEFSSAISGNAVLTVLTPTPPHLTGAASDTTFTTLRLTFDNRLDPSTATNATNYVISGGVTVTSATRDSTSRGIILRTSPMAQDTIYTVTVSNIRDETGTQVQVPNPASTNFSTLTLAVGYVQKEYYQQWTAGAGSVDGLVTAVRAGTTPITQSCLTNIWEYNISDQYDNYGGRMLGFFIPPVTGNYTFYLASDDNGRLFMSTDDNPANVREIAREPVWANRREWVGAGGGGGRTGASASGGPQQNISGSLTLTQGQRYYLESYFTEGGGGDNMGVAVQIPGGPVPVSGDPGIPANMIGTYVLAGTVGITTQPRSQTNVVNGFAQFTVSAVGSSTLCGGGTLGYQWRSNGVVIAGATSPNLIVGPLSASANGAVYTVSVTSPGRNVTSSNAVLTVNADTIKPTVVSVRADNTFRKLFVNYSELMQLGPATDSSNYQLYDPAQNQIFINSIDFINGSNAVLTLASALTENTVYSLEVDYQFDLAGNPTVKVGNPQVDPDNGVVVNVRSFVESRGFARFDAYLGLTVPNNNDVTPVITSPGYTNDVPSFFFYTNQVNWPQTVPDINNYGMRWRFFFTAPTDGSYKFEPAHDDGVRIYAATDGNPANKTAVFDEVCCNGFGSGEAGWTVALTAGQKVFIEVVVVEAGGGDYAGLSVTLPSGQYIAPITSQFISTYVDPAVGATNNVGIAQQPQSISIQANHKASFSVVVTNPGPSGAAYQWQLDTGTGFADILGAVTSSYTTAYQTAANNNNRYRVKVYVLGKTLISSNAVLTVTPDNVKPTVFRARGVRQLNALQVVFDGAMDSATATTLANYSLTTTSGTPVTLVGPPVLSADLTTVTIPTASPLTAGAYYVARVQTVADVALNVITTTNVTFQNWTVGPGSLIFEAYNTGGGNDVIILTTNVNYPNNPDASGHVTTADSRGFYPTDARESYGGRLSGYFVPTVSSNYTFYLRSDDASQLFLSTNASESNKVMLTQDTGCCGAFSAHPSSNSLSLVAGQQYYFELLYKEGVGGDYGQAAVKFTASTQNPDTLSPIPGIQLASLADPMGASITITQQPASLSVTQGANVTLSIGLVATNDYGDFDKRVIQWQSRSTPTAPWVNINGATGLSYNVGKISANTGTDYRALVYIPGAQATSSVATVVGLLNLIWTDPGVLQQANDVTGPWADIVPAATSPYPVDPRAAQRKYYRLRPLP